MPTVQNPIGLARGAMRLLRSKTSCTFRSWPISNRKGRPRALTAFMTKKTAHAHALYSSSIPMESFIGATSPRSVSIPEQTGSYPRSKILRRKGKRPSRRDDQSTDAA